MQSVYAFTTSKNTDLTKEEKFLSVSMENMYNLYLTLLGLLVEIQKQAEEQLTLSQKKYLATQEELNPKRKFIENQVLRHLLQDQVLSDKLQARKISWELDQEYVNILFKAITESECYREYMNEEDVDFKQDRNFIAQLYQEVIAPNEKLFEYIEDKKLTWVDDLPLVNTLLLKMLKKWKPSSEDSYFHPPLFKDQEDKEFANLLFKKTILNDEKIQREIQGKTPNWDTDRIADLDSFLLKMAICEFLYFPSIPIKVTINEYLEIAKEYSTPKSSIFINGILDKIVKEYKANNTLNKSGRGLM
jgi:N utilization substance protein B